MKENLLKKRIIGVLKTVITLLSVLTIIIIFKLPMPQIGAVH